MAVAELIELLKARQIQVHWVTALHAPGVWLAEDSLLILSASHQPEEQVAACRDVLVLTAPLAAA